MKDILTWACIAAGGAGIAMSIYEMGRARKWKPTYESPPTKDPNRFVYAWLAVVVVSMILMLLVAVVFDSFESKF